MKTYYVYILTNQPRGTLYVGVTNNLERRIYEHKNELVEGFSQKYHLKMLVYIQQYQYMQDALNLEKRLKRWHREWKINLIEKENPTWVDLSQIFFNI